MLNSKKYGLVTIPMLKDTQNIGITCSELFVQSLLLVTLLLSIFMHASEQEMLPTVLGFFSLVVFVGTVWVYWKNLFLFDLMVPFVFFLLTLYAQLVSQEGALNFTVALSYAFLGYSFGIIARASRFNKWILHTFGYLALAPFLYGFLIKGIDLSLGGDFLGMNRNTIPRLLFMSSSLVFVVQYMQRQRLDFFLAALTVLFCFLSRSRAGLLISSGLCVLVLFQGYVDIPKRTWLRGHRLQAVLLVLIVVFVLFFIGMYMFENSRLETQGIDSNGRKEIQMNFLNELNSSRILLGFRPAILEGIGLHSSYLTFLAMFGVFSTLVIFCLISIGLHLGKQSIFLFGVFLLYCVYSTVESLSPFSEGDVLMSALFIIIQKVKPSSSMKKT